MCHITLFLFIYLSSITIYKSASLSVSQLFISVYFSVQFAIKLFVHLSICLYVYACMYFLSIYFLFSIYLFLVFSPDFSGLQKSDIQLSVLLTHFSTHVYTDGSISLYGAGYAVLFPSRIFNFPFCPKSSALITKLYCVQRMSSLTSFLLFLYCYLIL